MKRVITLVSSTCECHGQCAIERIARVMADRWLLRWNQYTGHSFRSSQRPHGEFCCLAHLMRAAVPLVNSWSTLATSGETTENSGSETRVNSGDCRDTHERPDLHLSGATGSDTTAHRSGPSLALLREWIDTQPELCAPPTEQGEDTYRDHGSAHNGHRGGWADADAWPGTGPFPRRAHPPAGPPDLLAGVGPRTARRQPQSAPASSDQEYRSVRADCEAEKRRRRPQSFKIDDDHVLHRVWADLLRSRLPLAARPWRRWTRSLDT